MAHKFRSVFNVIEFFDFADGNLYLRLKSPGWVSYRSILLPADKLPKGMVDIIDSSPNVDECEIKLYAQAALSAEKASDLDISGPWEIHKFVKYENAARPLGLAFEELGKWHWDENGKLIDE